MSNSKEKEERKIETKQGGGGGGDQTSYHRQTKSKETQRNIIEVGSAGDSVLINKYLNEKIRFTSISSSIFSLAVT